MNTLVLPPCAYYIRRLVRQHLSPTAVDLLHTDDHTTTRARYTLETRLQQLYPDAAGHQNVVRHLEQLVHTHQQAKVDDNNHSLRTTAAQILWWLGYGVDRKAVGLTSTAAKVFVVDDTIETIKLASTLLVDAGYEVESALGGLLALKRLQQSAPDDTLPDLILLDLSLPDMAGTEVYQCLQADKRTQSIPVIFFSGLAPQIYYQQHKVQAIARTGYLQKPFKPSDLTQKVKQFIPQRSAASLTDEVLFSEIKTRQTEAMGLFF